jgi:translation initiation factor IF-3
MKFLDYCKYFFNLKKKSHGAKTLNEERDAKETNLEKVHILKTLKNVNKWK